MAEDAPTAAPHVTLADAAHDGRRPRWQWRMLLAAAATASAAGLFVTGWVVRSVESTAHAHNQAPVSATHSADACGPTCRAAYNAIAEALPHDRANVLSRAILRTSSFDFAQLAKDLNIPNVPKIQTQWRRYCNALFPNSPKDAERCFELILGPRGSALAS